MNETEKLLHQKLAEVEELRKKLASESESQTKFKQVEKKKKSKLPFFLLGILGLFVLIAMIPDVAPLTPEEIAQKETLAKEKNITTAKVNLEAAIETSSDKNIIRRFETLQSLDADSTVKYQQNYQTAKARIAEAEKQRKLNDLGKFYISNYVDEFGDKTKQKFIGYKGSGKFSNSATEGSALNVWVSIDSATEFDVSLYEYAGKNPVKDVFGGDAYVIRFRYGETTGKVTCKNSGDRISCGPKNSTTLIAALRKADSVKFSIYNQRTTSSQYSFTIDANGFSNALRKLNES